MRNKSFPIQRAAENCAVSLSKLKNYHAFQGKAQTLIQKQLEFSGESGKSYTFEVYTKSARFIFR